MWPCKSSNLAILDPMQPEYIVGNTFCYIVSLLQLVPTTDNFSKN